MAGVSRERVEWAAVRAGLVHDGDDIKWVAFDTDSDRVVMPHLHGGWGLADARCERREFRIGGEVVRVYVGRCPACAVAFIVEGVRPP